MEALSSSGLQIKRLSARSIGIQNAKTTNKHCAFLRISPSSSKTQSLRRLSRVSALAREVSDDGSGEEDSRLDNDNGVFRLVSEETLTLSQGNSDLRQSSVPDINLTSPPLTGSSDTTSGGGTRAGLFRTPISGGVQSATSAHGLPRPALVVRNLIEQARFAHLCTVMSRMHHRREGYPFGSLVDFAPDPMGHHHRRRNDRRNYSPGQSPELYWHSSRDCISSLRRLSTQPEYVEQFLPVQTLISLLDSYHDVTGLPWWIIISSSTVAMRFIIFPFIVLQLKKLRRIGELLPRLPPPFPPPGRNLRDQIALFWTEKEAAGCPSLFWFISSVAVQAPCFFLWLMTVRKMSLDHHPGFDTGGILWSLNLTEYPHGAFAPIIPMCIAGLHLANVQLSFRNSSLRQAPGTLKLLVKIYRVYLQMLTLPILIATFNVPQGSLVYWITNSTFSLIQLVVLRNPNVLDYLGLPEMNASASAVAPIVKQRGSAGTLDIVIRTDDGEILAQTLSPEDLVSFSIEVLGGGQKDGAIALLRLALEKDPGHVRAVLIMGQMLLQKEHYAEAADCLEKAVSKLIIAGNPTEVEEVDLLILSSQWAGIANVLQGKMEEGLVHLERIAQVKEPQDSKSRGHYYDGLIILSSALANVNRRAEALKYLHKAAAYNPAYNAYIEQLEADARGFASDLSDTKRYL